MLLFVVFNIYIFLLFSYLIHFSKYIIVFSNNLSLYKDNNIINIASYYNIIKKLSLNLFNKISIKEKEKN